MDRVMGGFDPMILESCLHYPKTLDKTVSVAREKAIQEDLIFLPENVAHESHAIVSASDYMDVTERDSAAGGTDCGGVEARAGSGKKRKRSPKKSSAGGTGGRAEGKSKGEKKRENWTDDETELLLKAVPRKTEFRSRIDRFSGNEPSWEGIAIEVSRRTAGECRRRMDTVIKSYKAIKEYCDKQEIEASQLNEKEFEGMMLAVPKLATRFKGRWYNYVRDYCPPRSNKKMRKQGAGSSLESGVSFVSSPPTSAIDHLT